MSRDVPDYWLKSTIGIQEWKEAYLKHSSRCYTQLWLLTLNLHWSANVSLECVFTCSCIWEICAPFPWIQATLNPGHICSRCLWQETSHTFCQLLKTSMYKHGAPSNKKTSNNIKGSPKKQVLSPFFYEGQFYMEATCSNLKDLSLHRWCVKVGHHYSAERRHLHIFTDTTSISHSKIWKT